jgi:hypothetical protein
MQAWLASLIVAIAEKLLTILGHDLELWIESRKQISIDQANAASQTKAAASGDENAIAQDGLDTLNGTSPK